MNLRCCKIPSIAAIIPFLLFSSLPEAAAVTRVTGNYFLEETNASGPGGSTNLVSGGVIYNIEPMTKKNLRLNFRVPLTFTYAEGERETSVTPSGAGNFAVDLSGDWFTLNLQYGRFATINSAAQLTESKVSSAAYSLAVPDLPRLNLNYSKTETTTAGASTLVDNYSVFSDYRYKWMNFRAGHFTTIVSTGGSAPLRYSNLLLGMGGSYKLLPAVILSFDDNFNLYEFDQSTGNRATAMTNVFGMNADSRPFEWLGIGGNYARTVNRTELDTFDDRSREANTSLYPTRNLVLSAARGNRKFSFAGEQRSVDYTTVGAAFSDKLIKTETIHVGFSATRSYNNDPSQGEDINDTYVVNALMDVRSGFSAAASMSVSRSENRQFVSARRYDAFGPLAERAQYNDRPAGFTFFDTGNNDLYTKNSSLPEDWSLPVHIEPVTSQYGVSKTLRVSMVPTDTSNLTISYTSNSSSDSLDVTETGGQSVTAYLTYAPKRRLNVSAYRTVSIPETGSRSNATSAGLLYQFPRGHTASVSYVRQESGGRPIEAFSGSLALGLSLPKRTSLQISYAVSQPGTVNETRIFKMGISKSF